MKKSRITLIFHIFKVEYCNEKVFKCFFYQAKNIFILNKLDSSLMFLNAIDMTKQ